jgi:hypothetical protein
VFPFASTRYNRIPKHPLAKIAISRILASFIYPKKPCLISACLFRESRFSKKELEKNPLFSSKWKFSRIGDFNDSANFGKTEITLERPSKADATPPLLQICFPLLPKREKFRLGKSEKLD